MVAYWITGISGSILDIVAYGGLQTRHEFGAGRAELLDDLVPLIDVVRAGKDDGAAQHLAEYAAHRPDVRVFLVAHRQYDLGGAVVARDHVRRHGEAGAGGARQSKVQDLERAVRADHNVARLQVPVYDAR